MTPEQIQQMLNDRRVAETTAIAALRRIPAIHVRELLNVLERFLEFDEEGVKDLLQRALD
jgi:hypothetical protein